MRLITHLLLLVFVTAACAIAFHSHNHLAKTPESCTTCTIAQPLLTYDAGQSGPPAIHPHFTASSPLFGAAVFISAIELSSHPTRAPPAHFAA